VRISLDLTGDKLAVQRQREACEAIVESRSWNPVGVYEDNSISASDKKKDRPGYSRLVADYEAGLFDALVCWDLDRLSRQPRQLEDWIDAAQERGLVLVTANGDADLSTDAGRLFARIRLAVAKSEVERKSARQKAAARQRSDLGKPPLGVRLTGYSSNGTVVDEEAVVVKEIFNRFAAGDSLAGIARGLQEQGTATRHGGSWSPSSIRTILTNPRYAGRAIYMGEVTGVEGTWTPLVDEATFHAAQARLSDPRRMTQVGTDRRHLGSGLYLCHLCATPVRSHNRAYRCKTSGHVMRSRAPVDQYVLDTLRSRLSQDDVVTALAGRDDATISEMDDACRRLTDRLAQIEADYDSGLIDGRRYATAREKVMVRLTAAEQKRAAAIGDPAIGLIVTASDPVAAFDEAPLMIRRSVLDAFVQVTLQPAPRGSRIFNPDTVVIEWRS